MQCSSPEARAAAAATRERNTREREATKGHMAVFAVRRGVGFSWEIRKFGGIVLASGTSSLDSREDAIAAGELARRALIQPA